MTKREICNQIANIIAFDSKQDAIEILRWIQNTNERQSLLSCRHAYGTREFDDREDAIANLISRLSAEHEDIIDYRLFCLLTSKTVCLTELEYGRSANLKDLLQWVEINLDILRTVGVKNFVEEILIAIPRGEEWFKMLWENFGGAS